MNRQHELTLQCVRSTLDGLICMNRSIDVVLSQEEKENNKQIDEPNENLDENVDDEFSVVLLSRLNEVCLKLSKNVEFVLRTTFSSKQIQPIPRQESTSSSISKQSVDESQEVSENLYEDMFDKLLLDFEQMKFRFNQEETRR